jgi:hypothetical protein
LAEDGSRGDQGSVGCGEEEEGEGGIVVTIFCLLLLVDVADVVAAVGKCS